MKKLLLLIVLALALLLLGWKWWSQPQQALPVPLQAVNEAPGPNPLREYLRIVEGTWANEGYLRGVANGQILRERQPDLSLRIDPNKVLGNQALIVVSEYCRPGWIEYLHFSLVNDHLELVGASQDGCFFQLPLMDYMEISYQLEEGDTVLVLEAQEMEGENFLQERLLRTNHSTTEASHWHCGLQSYLNALLQEGQFEIYDAEGLLISPQDAFGTEALNEELAYFDAYSPFWPGYEELCFRANLEVVVMGGTYPGDETTIYAVEWDVNEIRLFQTASDARSEDGTYPLRRGELAFRIVPFAIHRQPDL